MASDGQVFAPPTAAAENAEDRESSRRIGGLLELVPFMAPYWLMIVAASCALLLTSVVSLMLPLAVRQVVDNFEEGSLELLNGYFLAALLIAGLLALGTGVRYYLVTRIGERVIADIRKTVFDRMLGMSPAFFDMMKTGEILSRITTDTTLILSVISSSVSVFMRNSLLALGGTILMFVSSPKLTFYVVALVLPAIIVPIIVLGRRLRRVSRENQDWIAESSGQGSEVLTSIQAVQSANHEAKSSADFATVTEQSYESAKARIWVRALMTVIVIALVFAGVVAVLWIGARDVRSDVMTIGELVQFLIYAIIVAGAVGSLSEVWGELQRASGATERLVELLGMEDTVRDPDRPQPLPDMGRGAIQFDAVRFAYPSRPDRVVLEDISFRIEPGETVALVGPSGGGKTTIFQLLQRFYDPSAGVIRLDGVPIQDVARSDLRRALALVPQEPAIFARSARENIRFGRPEASDAEVEAAAKAAAAHGFLSTLPEGYDSYVGERGVMLSGGQKQRIAIARAILRDAPILLLDEATSALDAESEQAVQQAFAELSKGRTTLVIAHRLATVKRADRILVFEQGRIVAEGTHETLVAEGGLYARLARLQLTEGLAAE